VALHALKLAKPEIVTAGEESDDHFGEVGDVEGQEKRAAAASASAVRRGSSFTTTFVLQQQLALSWRRDDVEACRFDRRRASALTSRGPHG
jgi:hypothetical protein